MNNYEKMMEAAKQRFTSYDMRLLTTRCGVTDLGAFLETRFFDRRVLISKATGEMTVDGRSANFGETLSVFDWLCDAKPDACAAGDYCLVSQLSRVYVSGGGLSMNADAFADQVQQHPEQFRTACEKMGGKAVPLGDMGYEIPVFSNLSMRLKFYFADEEFPASLSFLWDKHTLDFVRYETVYYIAGCLRSCLTKGMHAET